MFRESECWDRFVSALSVFEGARHVERPKAGGSGDLGNPVGRVTAVTSRHPTHKCRLQFAVQARNRPTPFGRTPDSTPDPFVGVRALFICCVVQTMSCEDALLRA